MHVLLYVTRIS